MSIYSLSPKQAKERLRVSLKANVPCMLTGQPSSAKSYIVKELAQEEGLYLIDIRLSQLQPYDLSGLPKVVDSELPSGEIIQTSTYVPMDIFPLENYSIPKGYKGFAIFLDELNSADKYTQAASYKLLLDREIGNHKLHPTCRIIAAGNRMSDNAVVNSMGTAIRSRMTHISVKIDPKEFLSFVEEQVAKDLWNPIVYAFLNFNPGYINNFDPQIDTETFACGRTWEFLSKELNAGLLDLGKEIYMPAIIGTIGEKAGIDFVSFVEIMNSLPTIEQIVQNPTNAPLPYENGAKYALGAYLANKINSNNVDAIVDYIERIVEKDLVVLAYRIIIGKYPQIATNKKVLNTLGAIRHKLNNP